MTKTLATLLLATSLLACTDDKPQPEALALPGSAYYPESLTADAHGTLYVGSLTTGEVVAFDDGNPAPRTILAAGTVTGETGVLIHDNDLWLCAIDATFQHPTQIKQFGLDGTPKASYTLDPTQFCNDLAFAADGTLYATDSFSGNVLTVKDGAVVSLVQDARFVPASQGAFGLDGIVADSHGTLYVNKLDTGNLYAIDPATKAITEITVTPKLAGPDGMRLVDDHTLLVVEGQAGRVSRLAITGDTATSTPVATDLDQPTGVVQARGHAWVSEGQLGRLFAQPAQAPNLPFSVRRVD